MNLEIYLKPIMSAMYIFPLLAAVFTLPYIIFQYRKYGAILLLRVVIVYTFIFYMMTSYFMTILPLPPIDSVTSDTASVLLTPFEGIRNWQATSGIDFHDPSTYLHSLKNSFFLQMFFNVLLLFPFGVYLRYYFRRPWYQVIILSFLYSLFFELTQLSGLYGIYPHAYRYFEVDDLICNTLGGFLGFLFTPLFSFMLPSRKRLDQESYERGANVSLFRRIVALAVDFSIIIAFLWVLSEKSTRFSLITEETPFNVLTVPIATFIYFSMSMLLLRGRTLGKALVKIQLVNEEGTNPPFYKILIRNAILYLLIMPGLLHITSIITFLDTDNNSLRQFFLIMAVSIYLAFMIYNALNILICFARHDSQFMYDKICHLKSISTIKVHDKNTASGKKHKKGKGNNNEQNHGHSNSRHQPEYDDELDDLYDDEVVEPDDTIPTEDDIDIYY